jgi:hypothetical protein
MSSKSLIQKLLAFAVIAGLLVSITACNNASNTLELGQAVTPTTAPQPFNTPTVAATATVRPSPTPTEIPPLLPTPTVVGGLTPQPTNIPTPPAPSPTISPTLRPTDTPRPTPTPALAVRTFALIDEASTAGFFYPPDIPRPALLNSCLQATLGQNVSPVANGGSFIADTEPRYWATYTYLNYIRPATEGEDLIETQSIYFITRTAYTRVQMNNSYPDLVLTWNVMPSVSMQLFNSASDPNAYLRAYEQALDGFISRTLRETRARIVVGNVINIQDMRFFRPCFSRDTLENIQRTYNQMIANVVAKYSGRVFLADLTGIDIARQPSFTSVNNGYFLTQGGYEAVAEVFGRVINTRLGISRPLRPVSLNNPPTPGPYLGTPNTGGGNGGGGGGIIIILPTQGGTTPASSTQPQSVNSTQVAPRGEKR